MINMWNSINTMSSFEQQFDELPEDLQKMVCSKVVYTQPKELLDEIKEHFSFSYL